MAPVKTILDTLACLGHRQTTTKKNEYEPIGAITGAREEGALAEGEIVDSNL